MCNKIGHGGDEVAELVPAIVGALHHIFLPYGSVQFIMLERFTAGCILGSMLEISALAGIGRNAGPGPLLPF